MSGKVMQCCYSNVVSETGEAGGWQVTAFSEDIPVQVREEYGRIQDSNVTSQEPKDADGNPLNLFEIVIQKGYLMLTRVAYGLKDSGGRHNNMLSHSYLFKSDDAVLMDPNIFLSVEDSNFTDDIEKAKQIPDMLKRSEPYTLESAMELCRLDREKYVQLIYAMHIQKENKRTLYIHSSRGEEIIRPLIYCLWMGLPLSMRRIFSCASAVVNPNNARTLIFSADHGFSEFFFDLDTGENNVLDPRSIRKYKRWGYVDYFAENYESVDGKLYFKELEDTAVKLGDSKAAKAKVLKIAHQMITDGDGTELTFEDLQRDLFDALCAPVERNNYIDAYICSVLKKINADGRLLDSEMAEEALLERLNEKTLPALQEAGEDYLLRKITSVSPGEGARMLGQMKEQQFERFCDRIQRTENGYEYIDCYYESHFPKEITWKTLEDFLGEIDEHCDEIYPRTKEKLVRASRELYEKALDGPGSKREAYKKYTDFGAMIASTSDEESRLPQTAIKLYWDHFSMASFSYKDKEEYDFFRLEDHPVFQCVALLCRILGNLRKDSADTMIREMGIMLKKFPQLLPPETRRRLYEVILEYINVNSLSHQDMYANLFYLTMALGNTEFWRNYQKYAGMISTGETEEFIDLYENEIEKLQMEREREEMVRIYNITLFQYLDQESVLDDVTVDIILTAGMSMYGNPFDILDNLNLFPTRLCSLLERSPEKIVDDSVLLCTDMYMDYADEFIRGDSRYCQTVKEWMTEVKRHLKAEKSHRHSEGDIKAALGGIVNKIKSKIEPEDDGDDSGQRKKKGGFFGKR